MNERSTTLMTLLASLSLVIFTGCAPGTEAVDEEDAQEESVQEIRGALGAGVVSPRQYVGPVNSCPDGWQVTTAESRCYQLCPYGYYSTSYGVGTRHCVRDGYWSYHVDLRYMIPRASQALTCAPNLEYINGSCYRQCPAGSSSRGILGCEWGAQGQPAGGDGA